MGLEHVGLVAALEEPDQRFLRALRQALRDERPPVVVARRVKHQQAAGDEHPVHFGEHSRGIREVLHDHVRADDIA